MNEDTRTVYSVNCTWWDSIYKAGLNFGKLPCCPFCGSVLLEFENEDKFWEGSEEYEKNGHPNYREILKFTKGKCFKNMKLAEDAWLLPNPSPTKEE